MHPQMYCLRKCVITMVAFVSNGGWVWVDSLRTSTTCFGSYVSPALFGMQFLQQMEE